MLTQNDAVLIATELAEQAEAVLEKELAAVVVFGSYARNDFDAESDLDIMVRIRCAPDQLDVYERFFARLASRLSLKYDITVSVIVKDSRTFSAFKSVLPFYQNVEREGIKIA